MVKAIKELISFIRVTGMPKETIKCKMLKQTMEIATGLIRNVSFN
jgi:hypothetical protein